MYIGKHSFFTVSAEAELTPETASKAGQVVCQPFIRNDLSAYFHHSAISVPRHRRLCISVFTRDSRLINVGFFFQLKSDFFACAVIYSSHVINSEKIK